MREAPDSVMRPALELTCTRAANARSASFARERSVSSNCAERAREALGIEREVVVLGLGPLYAKVPPHDDAVRLVVDAHLLGDALRVVAAQALHHACLSQPLLVHEAAMP